MLLLVLAGQLLVVSSPGRWSACPATPDRVLVRKRSAALAAKRNSSSTGSATSACARDHAHLRQPGPSTSARSSSRDRRGRQPDDRAISLLIFARRDGQSAQFRCVGCRTRWRATPVSALIHAATMVNAVSTWSPGPTRSSPTPRGARRRRGDRHLHSILAVYRDDPDRHQAGARVIDLSQLGYMFAALGVGPWTAAIFPS